MSIRRRLVCWGMAWGLAFMGPCVAGVRSATTPPVAAPIKVVFLNPGSSAPDEVWWRLCASFMQAATKDLGMELKVYYAGRSAAEMHRQADEALKGPNKPDFIVMQNMKKTAPSIIKQAAEQGVKVLLFNSGLSDEESAEMGAPRERYANWIGQITPDDEGAGYDLADMLVRTAKKAKLKGGEAKVEMLALGGTVSDTSAIERNKGLERYVRSHENTVILNREHPLPADWDTEKAKTTLGAALPAYPNTTTIWAANDNMAMGALDAASSRLAKTPGKDIFIGGIDWNPESLAAVKVGTIAATIGGHFMEGAWAAVLIYDYVNGADFRPLGLSMKSRMGIITKDNLAQYERGLGDRSYERIDRIDFTRFSRKLNPRLKSYPFDLETVLKQLR